MAENNENMDNLNETVRKLDDSMRQMSERNEQMAAAMLAMMSNMTGTGKSMKDSTLSATEAAKSLRTLQRGIEETTEAEKINAEMSRKYAEAMANFSKAATSGTAALTSMTSAVLSGKDGFEKYNNTIKNAGDAALSLGKNFGILGTILGGVIKGFSMVAEMATKQADDLLKATDKISQTGAANKFSAEQVRQMGAKAGLASDQMDKLIKPMTSLSGGLTILGNSSSDGVKAFTEMTAVTKEQRMAFQRLGFDDEARIKAQADYVSLLEKSGAGLSKSEKTGESLRRQSLAYAENLVVLAEMSGKNVEEMKKQQEVNRATYEWKLMENKWAMDRKAAEAAGDTDKVKRIDAEKEAAKKLIDDVGALGDPAKTAAVQMQYLTGAITKESANMAVLGVDVQKQIDAAKKGQYKQGEFIDEYDKKAKTMLENNRTALAFSDELRKATGLTEQTIAGFTKRSTNDKTQVEIAAGGRQAVEDNKNNKGPAATDPAQVARNELTEAERSAKLKVDELIASMNPLLKGFDASTIAATALAAAAAIAATALTVMAGKAALGKVGDLLGDGKGKGKGTDKTGGKGKPTPPRGPDGRFVKAGATATKGAGMLGTLGKGASALGRVAGPAAGVIAVGAGAMTAYQGAKDVDEKVKSGELTKDEGTVKKSEAVGTGVGQAAGGAAGAWGGAAAGAAIGSVVPVVGTLIGGLLGAAVGGWLGSKGGEIVGEKVGKSVGKSMVDKPAIAGAPGAPVAGAPVAGAPVAGAPVAGAPVAGSPEAGNVAKIIADKEIEARKDSTKATDTLNKTYLSTKKAMEDLTQAINDLSNIATVKDQPGSSEDKAKRLEEIYKRISGASTSGGATAPSGGGGKATAPSGPGTTAPSGGGGKATAPSGPGTTAPSGGGGKATAPSGGGGKATAPSGPGTTAPSGGGATAPSGGGGKATAPSSSGGGKAGSSPPPLSPQPPDGSTDTASKIKPEDVIKFTAKSGSKEAFDGLNSGIKTAVLNAAEEYKASTGKIIQLNSAKRDPADQQRLYDDWVARGKTGMPVGKPGRSLHEKGEAVDIQNYNDPAAIAAFNKQGLSQKVPNDPVHFQARDGGMFNGPNSGYDVTLHGKEMVIPTPDVSKMFDGKDKVDKQELSSVFNQQNTNNTQSSDTATADMIAKLMEMMEEKMDDMIDKLSDSHSTQEQLLKYSKA
jgi:hypothetical protein